jgi:hypothetical protein
VADSCKHQIKENQTQFTLQLENQRVLTKNELQRLNTQYDQDMDELRTGLNNISQIKSQMSILESTTRYLGIGFGILTCSNLLLLGLRFLRF